MKEKKSKINEYFNSFSSLKKAVSDDKPLLSVI